MKDIGKFKVYEDVATAELPGVLEAAILEGESIYSILFAGTETNTAVYTVLVTKDKQTSLPTLSDITALKTKAA